MESTDVNVGSCCCCGLPVERLYYVVIQCSAAVMNQAKLGV